MSTPTIMIIRHGEKPVGDYYDGVSLLGQAANPPGADSLIPQGWMRCGALARFFVPLTDSPLRAGIALPTRLFAAASAEACPATFSLPPGSQQQPLPIIRASASTASLRSQELLLGVSALAQLAIDATYAPGSDESTLAKVVADLPHGSVALIAWEHDNIPKLAKCVDEALAAQVGSKIPHKWDAARFDLVWVFSLSASGNYKFHQIPQMLLPGDNPEPMAC
jgi:hypothetical protein